MKIFILYDKSGIYSGRALGSELIRRLRSKVSVKKGRPKRLEKLHRNGQRFDYIINIGWYKEFETHGAEVLNSPEKISLSSNKKKARVCFKEDKIPAPPLWTNWKEVRKRDLPVIGRTTRHSKGEGLWVCRSLPELQAAKEEGATHFLKLIQNTREFRVHIMSPKTSVEEVDAEDYTIIKLSEKVKQPGTKIDSIIKNHQNGWFFGYPENKKDPQLKIVRTVAKQALSEFGLHWGAVDIMISRDTGEPFVLEINSTPCLTDENSNTLEKYVEGICVLLGLEERKKKEKKVQKTAVAKPVPVVKQKKTKSSKANLKRLLQRV